MIAFVAPNEANRSLIAALCASVMLHALLLFALPEVRIPSPPVLPPLVAKLMSEPETPAVRQDDTLLNTMKPDEAPREKRMEPPLPPPAKEQRSSRAEERKPPSRPLEDLPQRLADRLYYPKEALQAGIEGEVVLFLEFDERGEIVNVILGSSSGSPVLDQAAMDAVRGLGRFPGAPVGRAVPLAVPFRAR